MCPGYLLLIHWPWEIWMNFFRDVMIKLISVIDGWSIFCEIALRWLSLELTDDKSTLVEVMAWCRQAASHYLNQRWPRSPTPYGVTRPQWLKGVQHEYGGQVAQRQQEFVVKACSSICKNPFKDIINDGVCYHLQKKNWSVQQNSCCCYFIIFFCTVAVTPVNNKGDSKEDPTNTAMSPDDKFSIWSSYIMYVHYLH